MLSNKVEHVLNKQIAIEAASSQVYLAMASWADINGLTGTAKFMYLHSDEERQHMLKLIKFVNDRGGHAIIPALDQPKAIYSDINEVFTDLLEHELEVTKSINEVVHTCLEDKDYTTHNFMQWFVSEQIEEEGLARTINDKLKMIGTDNGNLYIFDRDLESIVNESIANEANV